MIFLLADLEKSTEIKDLLESSQEGYDFVEKHNITVSDSIIRNGGYIIKYIGDAVFAKFEQESEIENIYRSLICSKNIVENIKKIEDEYQIETENGEERTYRMRTKVTLHYINKSNIFINDNIIHDIQGNKVKIKDYIGLEVDAFFRMTEISWRFQTLVSEDYMNELLKVSAMETKRKLTPKISTKHILKNMKKDRNDYKKNLQKNQIGKFYPLKVVHGENEIELFIVDGRLVTELKGVSEEKNLFVIKFRDPTTLDPNERPELKIKLKQGHHAVILVNVSAENESANSPEVYLNYVRDHVKKLSKYDSKLTLCVSAGIMGSYDYVFRISYSTDKAYRDFCKILYEDNHYNIRRFNDYHTISDHFFINPAHNHIINKFNDYAEQENSLYDKTPYQVYLVWMESHEFPNDKDKDITVYKKFINMIKEDEFLKPEEDGKQIESEDTHILEIAETTGHYPYYAIIISKSINKFYRLLNRNGIISDKCETYMFDLHSMSPEFINDTFRYDLVNGVYLPRPEGWYKKKTK